MKKVNKDTLAGIRCLLKSILPDCTEDELNSKIILMVDELSNPEALTKEEKPIQLLTYNEVAERLKVVVMTVRRLVEKGHLVKVKIGRRAVRVTEESLEKYLSMISNIF